MSRRIFVPVLALSLSASVAGVGGSLRPAGAEPATVTIAGSVQSELGCPGDWLPECTLTQLALDADDGVWQGSFSVPAGTYEYKAALDGTWDENYGLGAVRDGPNIPLVARRTGRGQVLLRRRVALGDRQPVVGDRHGAGQLPERARLRRRLGSGVPAVLAPGPRRRRGRHLLDHDAATRRLRGKGRHRRGVGRELRRRRNTGRRQHPVRSDRARRRRHVQLRRRAATRSTSP